MPSPCPLTVFHRAILYSADFEVGLGAVKGALRLPLACVLSHHTSTEVSEYQTLPSGEKKSRAEVR